MADNLTNRLNAKQILSGRQARRNSKRSVALIDEEDVRTPLVSVWVETVLPYLSHEGNYTQSL